jgi:transposase
VSDEPWTLARIYADLGSKTDVAKALDVGIHRFNKWVERQERTKCPQPVTIIAGTKVYSIVEWQGWFDRWMSTRAGWKSKGYRDGRPPLHAGWADTETP